jgi:hypothetical protein
MLALDKSSPDVGCGEQSERGALYSSPTPTPAMPNLSINELSELTGKTRATVVKALDGIPFLDGPKSAKLYASKVALEKIYHAPTEDGQKFISAAEAQRQLTIARREQITLEMECTRKERIPLEVTNEVNERAFSNVSGLLKAHEGKQLDQTLIGDILSELRQITESIREWMKSAS